MAVYLSTRQPNGVKAWRYRFELASRIVHSGTPAALATRGIGPRQYIVPR